MFGLVRNHSDEERLHDIPSEISAYLYAQFSAENSRLRWLDRWTQLRVSEENFAKVALVIAADDPVEHCYQDLIREIDTEAQSGIYLARPGAKTTSLKILNGESGISGELHQRMRHIAPTLFPDELEHSRENLDIVWATIEARYDRAYLDAEVSRLLITRLLGDEEAANDMTDALRALMYAFNEDLVRRQCEMPLLLNERATADLVTMIAELDERSGDYDERVRAIGEMAGTT
jgi:hypothetical protein